jgi:hypothetical protein
MRPSGRIVENADWLCADRAAGRCRTDQRGDPQAGDLQCRTLEAASREHALVDPNLPVGTQLSFDSVAFSDNFEESPPVVLMQRKTVAVAAAPAQIDVPGTFDPNLSNNITSIQFDTNAFADLAITKSALGDVVTSYNPTLGTFTKSQVANSVTAGELLEYTLVVTHKGPSLARGVKIRDDLPGPAGPIRRWPSCNRRRRRTGSS